MKFIYMHHAERNVTSETDPVLKQLEDITERGIKEAELVADRLKEQKIISLREGVTI